MLHFPQMKWLIWWTCIHGKSTGEWNTNDIQVHTSDIWMKYKYIWVAYRWHTSDIQVTSRWHTSTRVTSRWHTSTYEWHMDDMRVHMSYIKMTYEWHASTYKWHMNDISTYKWHMTTYEWRTSDLQMIYGLKENKVNFFKAFW